MSRSADLRVESLADVSQLRRHIGAWEELAAAALEPNVFHEPWMLLPALEEYRADAAVQMVLVFAGRELCGVFPLERRYHRLGAAVWRLWAYKHCFLNTPLVCATRGPQVVDALLAWLADEPQCGILLQLPNVAAEGPFQRALAECVRRRGTRVLVTRRASRPTLRLADCAAPENALSSVRRKKLRRSRARLATRGAMEFRSLDSTGDVRLWIAEFLRVEASGWKGLSGTSLAQNESDRRFFETVITEAFRRGRLEMLSLYSDGKPIALLTNFLCPPGAFAFKVAFDEAYASYSPGVLLEIENMQRLGASGGIEWMDSCISSPTSPVCFLWPGRRLLEFSTVTTGRQPGGIVLALMPLLRWLRRSTRALISLVGLGSETP